MVFEPTTKIDTQELLTRLAPALAGGRLTEALQIVQANWTVPQLITLLDPKSNPGLPPDVRKLAAAALGLVGDRRAVTPLAVALHDADPMITQMAEHSLWSIWFRLGKPAAVCLLNRGSCHLNHGNFDHAAEKFSEALHLDPTFAEAYNQRALAYYLAERYPEAQQDCQRDPVQAPIGDHFNEAGPTVGGG
ncbi:MAG: tetratricopeptide repeat protein [Phycisphaerae bacterium]